MHAITFYFHPLNKVYQHTENFLLLLCKSREILDQDIITPDKGRAVAKEIGAHYYETSVLEQYGIEEVFINSIRSALSAKREKHFWTVLGSLKHIRHPLAQKPLQPKQPPQPHITIDPSELDHDYEKLLESESFSDVIFSVGGVCLRAHKACLIVAGGDVFKELFLTDLTAITPPPPSSSSQSSSHYHHENILSTHHEQSDVKNGNVNLGAIVVHEDCSKESRRVGNGNRKHTVDNSKAMKDTVNLLDHEETSSLWSLNTSDSASLKSGLPRLDLNHRAFKCIELQVCVCRCFVWQGRVLSHRCGKC